MTAQMMQPQAATTNFIYGKNIWEEGKNGIILIDSNTMDLSSTPCVHQLPANLRNQALALIGSSESLHVERIVGEDGKVTMDRSVYDAVKNQGDLTIERRLHGYGDPQLMGTIRQLPGVDNTFVMGTSFHNNDQGVWSPTSLAVALREYCMYACMIGIQHLPIYMSMVGLQYTGALKWDVNKLQSPDNKRVGNGFPSYYPPAHDVDVRKIAQVVRDVLPAGGHVQVVV